MSLTQIILIVACFSIVLIGLKAIQVYNLLTVLRNSYENAFAQIDVALARRHDLIPNLVEVAKKYMEHEHDTLEDVMRARNQASQTLNNAKKNLNDESTMALMAKAESTLNSSLGRLMAVVESYPDLKANEQMNSLSKELVDSENLIAAHRLTYNDSINIYNNSLMIFPNNVFSIIGKFKNAAWLPIEEEKREAPKVSF